MFKNRCYQGGKKHKFIAIYDEYPNELFCNLMSNHEFSSGRGRTTPEVRSMFIIKKYDHTQCEWCGKVTLVRKIKGEE